MIIFCWTGSMFSQLFLFLPLDNRPRSSEVILWTFLRMLSLAQLLLSEPCDVLSGRILKEEESLTGTS